MLNHYRNVSGEWQPCYRMVWRESDSAGVPLFFLCALGFWNYGWAGWSLWPFPTLMIVWRQRGCVCATERCDHGGNWICALPPNCLSLIKLCWLPVFPPCFCLFVSFGTFFLKRNKDCTITQIRTTRRLLIPVLEGAMLVIPRYIAFLSSHKLIIGLFAFT